MELCLDEGLGLTEAGYGSELDLDGLIRMDTASQIQALSEGVKGGLVSPNEGRKRINLPPVKGGDTPYMQEQNWPVSSLASRPMPSREITAPAKPSESKDKALIQKMAFGLAAAAFAESRSV